MIEFKPLELKDREIFIEYLGEYEFNTYEYSFLTLYLWRKMYSTEFAIIDDALIIKKTDKYTGSCFMQPIGYSKANIKSIILKLYDIRKNNADFKCLFRDIEAPFLNQIKEVFGENIVIHEDTNNFDYLYDCKQLASLSGNKFHRKKNQYNQFVNKYSYEVKDMHGEEVINDCMDFMKKWYEKKVDRNDFLKYELEGVRDVLMNMPLLNIKGMAVYIGSSMAGFTIGEKVNRNMAIIHVEKGDLAYSGIYPFIIKTFAGEYLGDVSCIDRQEDLGVEGLRKAKMAYNPVRLEKKYILDLYDEVNKL